MFRLYLLGAIDLRDPDGRAVEAVLAQRKRLALLAFLAATPASLIPRRDTLLAIFWPELDQKHARNALSKAVHFLRQALGEAAVVSRSADELALGEAAVWADVRAFRSALDEGRQEEALALYRGDLLPAFFPDAPGFEEWLERERALLRSRAAEAARLLADRHEAEGRLDLATNCIQRAVDLSGGDERPIRRLIELHDRMGDRSGALRAYDSFARRLAAELEVEPAAETVALIQRVRAHQPVQPTPVASPPRPETRDPASETAVARLAGGGLPEVEPRRRSRWPPVLAVAALAGLGLVGALALEFRGRNPPPTLDADLVAIAPFDVLDPALAVWGEGVVDVLSRNLDAAGPLRTVSPTVAIRRWRGRAEAGAARVLGQETGARLVVYGQLLGSGADSLRIRATLLDAADGRSLGEVELRGASDRMDTLLDALTLELLRELGRGRPVAAARRGSITRRPLPALKAFLQGEQFFRRTMWDSALVQYDHAIALDSGFALAYFRVAQVLSWSPVRGREYPGPGEYARRAAGLDPGHTARDSLLLVALSSDPQLWPRDSGYFIRYRRHLAALEEASRRYPGDPDVWYALGEARYHQHETDNVTLAEPLDAFDRAIELDSSFAPAYIHTVRLAIALGDYDRARRYAAAHVASAPPGNAAPSLHIDALLLDPARAGSAELERLIDTVAGPELWLAAFDLAQWPDPAESSVRLARALLSPGRRFPGGNDPMNHPTGPPSVLASMLAFRGHLEEASRASPPFAFRWPVVWAHPFPDLALLGIVPADSVAAVFGLMLRVDSLWPAGGQQRRALPWWSLVGDSMSLAWFARRADSAGRAHSNPIARPHLSALADAARAHLSLVRGDSAGALRALSALPDSLCILSDCFFEKVTQARLEAALGHDRSAAATFERWIRGRHMSPISVLMTLERGRIAERLGERDQAVAAYGFVADVWQQADSVLQPYVAEAREGLRRLAAGSP